MPNNLNVNDISGAVNRVLLQAQGISLGGGGSGVIVLDAVQNNPGEFTLNKTWQEIYDAICSGTIVYVRYTFDGMLYVLLEWIVQVNQDNDTGKYLISSVTFDGSTRYNTWSASTPNDNPELNM